MEQRGLTIHQETSFCSTLQQLKEHDYTAVLLNLRFGNDRAFNILSQVTQATANPIFVLTEQFESVDRMMAYELGVEDFLSHHLSSRELVTRLQAGIRRHQWTDQGHQAEASILTSHDLQLNPAARVLKKGGKPVSLTPSEFDLLERLMRKPGQVFTRESLLETIAPDPYSVLDRTIDVHNAALRRKLGDNTQQPRYIRTAWGVGYAFLQANECPELRKENSTPDSGNSIA